MNTSGAFKIDQITSRSHAHVGSEFCLLLTGFSIIKMAKCTLLLLLFCFLSCTPAIFNYAESSLYKNEISFNLDGYKEYIWKTYDDTVKVKSPRIVGIKGIYNLEYKLNADSIRILKHDYAYRFRKPDEQGELIFEKELNLAHRTNFKRIIQQVDFEKIKIRKLKTLQKTDLAWMLFLQLMVKGKRFTGMRSMW